MGFTIYFHKYKVLIKKGTFCKRKTKNIFAITQIFTFQRFLQNLAYIYICLLVVLQVEFLEMLVAIGEVPFSVS